MTDSKVSSLTNHTAPTSEDYLYIIDDPNGTPTSKKITLKNLFGNINSNTTINARTTINANTTVNGSNAYFTANTNFNGITRANQLRVTNNEMRIQSSQTPANSTITKTHGTIFWDANYIYVTTSNNVTKRVALSSF